MIVLSDHGLTAMGKGQMVVLDELVDASHFRLLYYGPTAGLGLSNEDGEGGGANLRVSPARMSMSSPRTRTLTRPSSTVTSKVSPSTYCATNSA